MLVGLLIVLFLAVTSLYLAALYQYVRKDNLELAAIFYWVGTCAGIMIGGLGIQIAFARIA